MNLLHYLWYLYSERKLSWRTIGVHRSAVATLLQPYAPETISEDRRVCRFMRATYLSRPPPRKIKPIWDVATVLRCLEGWGDINNLSRTRLTHRMVMLLAIASAKRVSDLMLLRTDVDSLQQTPDKWVFLPAFGAKQERPNHSVPPLVFTRNGENANICPVSHLSAYMKITESDRKALYSNVLLLTCIAPSRSAARFTVARWLMLVLRDAGAGDTAGSTRATAATWAMARGVTVNTIMQAADWTSARTMRAHYLRLLPREALVATNTVLGPYSREDHLTLGFFRNFKMRNSVTAELRKSLFSNYLRKTVVAEFRILTFMQNTPFFPRI